MNKRNPFLFFTILSALIAGYFLFSFYSLKEYEHKLRVQKENELQSKIAELLQKEADFSALVGEKASSEKRLNEKIAVLEEEIAGHKTELDALTLKLEALKQDKEALEKGNSDKQRKLEDLTKKIQLLESDKSDLVGAVNSLKAGLENAAKSAQNSPSSPKETVKRQSPVPLEPLSEVELGQIVVQKSSGSAARVQNVNIVYGFVIVTAGSKDGLRPNLMLNIIRDNRLIGKAMVQKVKPAVSAAVLLPEYAYGEVQVGDLVSAA